MNNIVEEKNTNTKELLETAPKEKNQSTGLSAHRLMGDLRLNLTQPECSGPSM